jgi:hypothetical protein
MGCGAEVSRSQDQLAEQLLGIQEFHEPRIIWGKRRIFAGCSKSPFSKAAGSSATEAYPWGTLQGDERLRTPLADFFSILSSFGFAVVQMPMLPVEPGMAKFVGENVAPSGYG